MMRRQDFRTGVENEGEFEGRRYVDILVNAKNHKTQKLNLMNETFDSNDDQHRIHKDPDDPFDFVRVGI